MESQAKLNAASKTTRTVFIRGSINQSDINVSGTHYPKKERIRELIIKKKNLADFVCRNFLVLGCLKQPKHKEN